MRKLMLLLAFLVFATPAWAQRVLPSDAKRGQIGARQMLPMVQIGNQTRRLAPGGVIIDTNNRSITHQQLLPAAEVLYMLDRNDEVSRLIILTPEEQARLDRAK
jgi:hypothetical protein